MAPIYNIHWWWETSTPHLVLAIYCALQRFDSLSCCMQFSLKPRGENRHVFRNLGSIIGLLIHLKGGVEMVIFIHVQTAHYTKHGVSYLIKQNYCTCAYETNMKRNVFHSGRVDGQRSISY